MSTLNRNNTYFLKFKMRLLKMKTGISIMKNTLKGFTANVTFQKEGPVKGGHTAI